METIRDMLWVRTIERRLRRKLTDIELSGEEFQAVYPDGNSEFLATPLIPFPWGLLNKSDNLPGSVNKLSKLGDTSAHPRAGEWQPKASQPEILSVWDIENEESYEAV
jgi:hypothetical protein